MGVVVDFIASILKRRTAVGGSAAGNTPAPAFFDQAALFETLAQLDSAKASNVDALARLSWGCVTYGVGRRHVANVAMQTFPDAAWVLSFDRDGYIREAALRRIAGPAVSVGRFVSIALRLNDWVPEVRAEAVRTVKAVGPATSPEIIAAAAPFLLRQRYLWKRWDNETLYVDELLARPDVAEAVTLMLRDSLAGVLGSTLRLALRFPIYDAKLVTLATAAQRPDVRSVAFKTILGGRAVWPIGYGWEWIDKSLGQRRRTIRTESRPVSSPAPANFLELGLRDRSASVRKVAADAVIERIGSVPEVSVIAARLAKDKSAAVRDRADYIMRHLPLSPPG